MIDQGFFAKHLLGKKELTQVEMDAAFSDAWSYVAARGGIIDIPIDETLRNDSKEWAERVKEAKSLEDHHKKDGRSESKRWTTGDIVEKAVRIALGRPGLPEESRTVGESPEFVGHDLLDLGTEVETKGSTWGLLPVVKKGEERAQIIGILSEARDVVHVLGLALPCYLHTRSSRLLVKDQEMYKSKGGFWGFEKLIPLPSLEELIRMFPVKQ